MAHPRTIVPVTVTVTVAALAALVLAGCSSTPASPAGSAKAGQIAVVASTNVWGSVAGAVGGDRVAVTSIIDDPNKDPHEYQGDARNQLAISKADIVIENGGGYDDFVSKLVAGAKTDATILTATDISGYGRTSADGEFNEHVWYDLPTVREVASALADSFTQHAPGAAADFAANAAAFDRQLRGLEASAAQLKAKHAGTEVTITESVPVYLLDAIGLKNVTPRKFSEAIEDETDVPPAVLQQTLELYAGGAVKLLAYNEQTAGPQTEQVRAAAKKHGVPVVAVTETLPRGTGYVEWMTATLDAIGKALA